MSQANDEIRAGLLREIQNDVRKGIRPGPKIVDSAPETIDAAVAGQAIYQAREAGRDDVRRQHLAESLSESESRYLQGEFAAVTSGNRSPLAAVQNLLQAGNREGVDALLAGLAETEYAFEAEALGEAIATHEQDSQLSHDWAKQSAQLVDEEAAYARLRTVRPDLTNLDEMRAAAARSGEEVSPREVAARAQAVRVVDDQTRLKNSILAEDFKSRGAIRRFDVGGRELHEAPTVDPLRVAQQVADRAAIAHPLTQNERTRIGVLGSQEIDASELNAVRANALQRKGDLLKRLREDKRPF